MKQKSDALIVIPTILNSISAFSIFNNEWIIADSQFLYKMSKNAKTIIDKLEIQDTQNLYQTQQQIIDQTKDGWIIIINESFQIQQKYHVNIFRFCKLCLHNDQLYFMNSNQLEARNIIDQQIDYYSYKNEIFCTSLNVITYADDEFITITLDNGLLDVLKNGTIFQKYNLTTNKQDPVFIFDCCSQIQIDEIIIVVATNKQQIVILKEGNKQQEIQLSFSPTRLLFFDLNQINPIIALNKEKISLVNNKEICKFSFSNITNCFYHNYLYLCTNEHIVIINLLQLKK